jgi:RNA polymerase sigma-70 factor (ECF subfamily)
MAATVWQMKGASPLTLEDERPSVRDVSGSVDEQTVRDFLATDCSRVVGALTLAAGSRAAAEDAVSEALARAWERSDRGEHIDSLPAWVTVVGLNLVRSGWRRRLAERRAVDRVLPAPDAAGTDDLVDVRRALASLPRRQREATVLRYYLDYDVAAVATALGITEGTAKATLFRARQSLAAALGDPADEED